MSRTKTKPKPTTAAEGRPKKGFKRSSMPLYGESVLNFVCKLLFGVLIFWMLFYPMYAADPTMSLIDQMSYIVLFTTLSSITAVFLAYFMVSVVTYLLKRPSKGMFDINHFPNMDSFVYEALAILINAFVMATSLFVVLQEITMTWEQFFLLYVVVKLIDRLLAYGLAKLMGNNLILSVGIILVFIVLFIMALNNLLGVSILDI